MRQILSALTSAAILLASGAASAAFAPDEFTGTTLGPQWSFGDSTPAGTTYTLTSGKLVLTPAENSDLFTFVDTQGYVQQDAPAGTNWEVEVKIDGYDPTQAGQQRDFTRCGIQLWQDNNHHVFVSLLSNGDGLQMGTQAVIQTDPGPLNSGNIRYAKILDIFNTGPQPTYWLKLQKTARGYQGFYSTDGTNYINCMAIGRNRETADGYFTNEKIRLFTAGGFGAGSVTPVQFDYIHTAAVTPPVSGYQDDEFNGTSLNPRWGYHPGIAFGSIGFNEGQLVMTPGPFSNVWEDRDQSQYIHQDAPTSASYALTAKVGPGLMTQPGLTYELFSSYGLWLWRDTATWAMILNQRGEVPATGGGFTPNNRIEVAFLRDGLFDTITVPFGDNPCPGYLRIEKVNDQANVQYSFDNVNWTTVNLGAAGSNFFVGTSNHQIRLLTKRVFDNGAPPDATFDWLHVSPASVSGISDWQLF